MENNIYRVAAFTDNADGGNMAGVVLDADALTEKDMLGIAAEIGYSETAFIMKSSVADFKVRFFTPVDEVDLCGHATVAAFNLLRDIGIVSTGSYTQETKAGILRIVIYRGSIYLQQNLPEYYELIPKSVLENCFESQHENYTGDMPIQIVSTALKDIILPVKNLETLLDLKANSSMIQAISEKYDVVGIHAFCLETMNEGDAHTRNFAPRYGIDEESATGTANGALACYLMKYRSNDCNGKYVIEQGYSMKRPSKILVDLTHEGEEVNDVYVGGSAVIMTQ